MRSRQRPCPLRWKVVGKVHRERFLLGTAAQPVDHLAEAPGQVVSAVKVQQTTALHAGQRKQVARLNVAIYFTNVQLASQKRRVPTGSVRTAHAT